MGTRDLGVSRGALQPTVDSGDRKKQKGPDRYRESGPNIGRDDWIRTSDPLTPSQVRYQAAPHPDARARRPTSYFTARVRLPPSSLRDYGAQGSRTLRQKRYVDYALARFPRLDAAVGFPDPRLATCLAMTRDFGRASSERRGDLAAAGGVNR